MDQIHTNSLRLALGAVCAGGLLVGGCRSVQKVASYERRQAAIQITTIDAGDQGAASDVVFSNPDVRRYYIAVRPELIGELSRRDEELAIYDPAPVTAIDGWPQRPRPSLSRQRIRRTGTRNADRFVYYELEGSPDRRHHHDGYTPYRYYE